MKLLIILAMLWPFRSMGQRELRIGEMVPNIEWTVVKNYEHPVVRTEDFKDRLLILDFWASWCTGCLENFAKLDSLQAKFGDQLQVMLVNAKNTRDNEQKIDIYFDKHRYKDKKYRLPGVVYDSVAARMFPHKGLPHYVWIYKGVFKAMTGSDDVNENNIKGLLDGAEPALTIKKDVNRDRPLYTSEELPIEKLVHFSMLLKGRQEGLPSGSRPRYSGSILCGRSITNIPLAEIYRLIVSYKLKQFDPKRVLLEARDTCDLVPPPDKELKKSWYKNHMYSYELIVTPAQAPNLYELMLEELNRLSGYNARMEKRMSACLVLLYDSSGKERKMPLFPAGTIIQKNRTTRELSGMLNDIKWIRLPLVDGIQTYCNVVLPEKIEDMQLLQKFLKEQGFMLKEEQREMEFLVIRDKQ